MTGADMQSCLYFGKVMHARLRPFRHRFTYRVCYLHADLDELAGLGRRLRLFSHNRFNLFSFLDRDHGPGDGAPLRQWVESQLAAAGLAYGGPIRILCLPRILGYVFNPLSIYYCHAADGRLSAILYEVNNTFGDRHSYLLPVTDPGSHAVRQKCDKALYVSPFMAMDARYRFYLRPPGERLSVGIRESINDDGHLVATLTGRRVALSDRRIVRAFFSYPLLTLKVIAAIHWQALHLWRKGARLVRRPSAPACPVTAVVPEAPSPACPVRHAASPPSSAWEPAAAS